MKSKTQKISAIFAIFVFAVFILGVIFMRPSFERVAVAQNHSYKKTMPTPESTPPAFNQEEAIAKIREQIKGRENEPAGEVFKNIQQFKQVPAGRLLAIMKFGYARSLGVNCTHCHTPENWASEEKPTKQIARDMRTMSSKINSDLLKNMESLGGRRAIVNCTTCHRGAVKPALNLPRPKTK